MNWLILRQYRRPLLITALTLLAFSVLLIVTGRHMDHTYHVALTTCNATRTCDDLGNELFQGQWYGALSDLIGITIIVPVLIGLFWGAPLVAKDLEDGTHKLVWTQSVTRLRWMTTKVVWALGLAAIWGAAVSALVTWWSGPDNALQLFRFKQGHFDTQGIVPIAYCVFAAALGLAAAAWRKRVLPALAITVATFGFMRIGLLALLRPHYMAPLRDPILLVDGGTTGPGGSAWILSDAITDPRGHSIDKGASSFPADCLNPASTRDSAFRCLAQHGYHRVITYQPGGRFWTFQAIESSVFLASAAVLIAFAFWRVLRTDA